MVSLGPRAVDMGSRCMNAASVENLLRPATMPEEGSFRGLQFRMMGLYRLGENRHWEYYSTDRAASIKLPIMVGKHRLSEECSDWPVRYRNQTRQKSREEE